MIDLVKREVTKEGVSEERRILTANDKHGSERSDEDRVKVDETSV